MKVQYKGFMAAVSIGLMVPVVASDHTQIPHWRCDGLGTSISAVRYSSCVSQTL